MEILDKKIRNFLLLPHHNSDGDGRGYGDGDGYGYGDGYGCGYGDGYGCGYGCGYGDGDGDGSGYGGGGSGYGGGDSSGYSGGGGDDGGVKNINGDTIYSIDSIQTIILSIRGNIAKGYILNKDLTLSPCYVIKNDYFFAHGSSIKEALEALEEKTTSELPISQRIKIFKSQFKDFNVKVKAQLLYDWHHKLTGSCKMGRDSFCTNNNINLKKDKLTVDEFIELTKKEYGGEIIKQLKNET